MKRTHKHKHKSTLWLWDFSCNAPYLLFYSDESNEPLIQTSFWFNFIFTAFGLWLIRALPEIDSPSLQCDMKFKPGAIWIQSLYIHFAIWCSILEKKRPIKCSPNYNANVLNRIFYCSFLLLLRFNYIRWFSTATSSLSHITISFIVRMSQILIALFACDFWILLPRLWSARLHFNLRFSDVTFFISLFAVSN